MSEDANFSNAVSSQQRFEFYLIGLTFTILGLSIQTSSFGRNLFADGFEILGWLAMLCSGVVGLNRLEKAPHIFELYGHLDSFEDRRRQIQASMARSGPMVFVAGKGPTPAAEVLSETESAITQLEAGVKPQNKSIARQYRWQKWLLVSGMGLLIASRAYITVARIILLAK